MRTITTGRPLDENGEPIDEQGLELDPEGPAAERLRESSRPLVSSPGAGTWASLLQHPDDAATRPVLLQWLVPDATEPPTHVHPRSETFRPVDGELTVVVEGEPRRIGPDEEITVQPGEEHTFRNDTDDVVAFVAELSSVRTVAALFSIWGLDHEGAFGADGAYGEPGPIHGLLLGEALRGDTTMTMAPLAVQRVLWATVGRVAKFRGYRAIEDKYLSDEFWETTVEQPPL